MFQEKEEISFASPEPSWNGQKEAENLTYWENHGGVSESISGFL